jgi:hypothetical protein
MTNENNKIMFRADDDTKAVLDALDELATQLFHETGEHLGPGVFPFKSVIIRKAIRVAAPEIRAGLLEEGIPYLRV